MLAVMSIAMLLAVEPSLVDELEKAFQGLKEAETQKNAELVKQRATESYAIARKIAATPAPEAEADQKAWKDRVAYARDMQVQTEYSVFVTALQAKPATTVDLMAALVEMNPKSKYLDEGYSRYLLALNQSGAAAKIPAVAEKGLASFPENEDLLLVMADNASNRKQSDRALDYSRRLINVLNRHPKPAGMSEADWERKKTASLARAYWISGVICGEKGIYAESNRNLRAALPLVKGNDNMTAAALFFLGVANFQLGQTTLNKAQVQEAAKFSEQAAAIPGPYSAQAWTNSLHMKTAAAKMR